MFRWTSGSEPGGKYPKGGKWNFTGLYPARLPSEIWLKTACTLQRLAADSQGTTKSVTLLLMQFYE